MVVLDWRCDYRMGKIIDGKKISNEIKDGLKEIVADLNKKNIHPKLVVVQVGNDEASSIYINGKRKDCEYVGIEFELIKLDENIDEDTLLDVLYDLNYYDDVNGIIVQLPLPEHINEKLVMQSINPDKDVDGFSTKNMGNIFTGDYVHSFACCTPRGIVELLKASGVELEGKECVVIGRSNHVGKQTAVLLTEENATVTLAHSKTRNLKEITRRADIVVAALGKPKFIKSEHLKDGVVVVDVGIHRDTNGKVCGDVDFDDVIEKVGAITPVPGGVGLMTRAMLLSNCILSSVRTGRV